MYDWITDLEERRLTINYSESTKQYSDAALRVDAARMNQMKEAYAEAIQVAEAARHRCEAARFALDSYRAGKRGV